MFKKIFIILVSVFIFSQYIGVSHGASTGNGGKQSYSDLYSDAKKFVLRAKKLAKKNKIDRATKLYSKALEKLQKA